MMRLVQLRSRVSGAYSKALESAKELNLSAGLDETVPRSPIPFRVFAADSSIVWIGIGPTRVPIGLSRVSDCVHHKRVDVRDSQAMFFQMVPYGLFALFQQSSGPGVWNIGKDFDSRITEISDFLDGIFDREVHVGVTAEGNFHRDSVLAKYR